MEIKSFSTAYYESCRSIIQFYVTLSYQVHIVIADLPASRCPRVFFGVGRWRWRRPTTIAPSSWPGLKRRHRFRWQTFDAMARKVWGLTWSISANAISKPAPTRRKRRFITQATRWWWSHRRWYRVWVEIAGIRIGIGMPIEMRYWWRIPIVRHRRWCASPSHVPRRLCTLQSVRLWRRRLAIASWLRVVSKGLDPLRVESKIVIVRNLTLVLIQRIGFIGEV